MPALLSSVAQVVLKCKDIRKNSWIRTGSGFASECTWPPNTTVVHCAKKYAAKILNKIHFYLYLVALLVTQFAKTTNIPAQLSEQPAGRHKE